MNLIFAVKLTMDHVKVQTDYVDYLRIFINNLIYLIES